MTASLLAFIPVALLLTLIPALLLPRKREEAHLLDQEGVPPIVVP